MSLVLEIEYLSGICFAAIGPDTDAPDWPPQPDRVFSALVASWGARGEKKEEAHALEWLEVQPAPKIEASDHLPRTAPAVYVPPNDYEAPSNELSNLKWYRDFLSKGVTPPEKGGYKKLWLQAWNVMPDQRKRTGLKERSFGFPAARPSNPVVRLFWIENEPDDNIFAALQRLAADTAYVGHSASLTRCHFRRTDDAPAPKEVGLSKRRIYPGRFVELRNSYEVFVKSNGKKGRPLSGAEVKPEAPASKTLPHAFGDHWLLLEHVSGEMPDIRASAVVAKAIRDTLLSAYKRIGLEGRIPEVVSGHAADGSPSRMPHLAIVPLAFVGFPHADGHVMGFALVPPRDSGILDEMDFRSALRKIAPLNENLGRRLLVVKPKAGTPAERAFSVGLSPTFETPAGKRSLDPALYIKPVRTFASLTPIVLDRHLKRKDEEQREEIAAQIIAACRNIGLPEPEMIGPDKHSAIEGAPSARPSGKSPAWMHWRLPETLKNRQLTHAVIRFAEPVQGPVILGAGRFVGLGLLRPLFNSEDRA